MECFSTEALPVARRAAAWNDLYSSQLNRVDFTPEDRHGFRAELRLSRFGPISLARMTADRSNIERTRRHIVPGSQRIYSFLLQAQGTSVLDHCGHQAQLEAGDFALCDSAAPHRFTVDGRAKIIMLRVPAELLREHLPTPEQFCGLRLGGNMALTPTMAAMLETLNTSVEAGFGSSYDARFARHMLEMLAMNYAVGFDARSPASSVVLGRQANVVRFIEDNLRDPALSPAAVATALRISPRYLRSIFATSGEKVSSYISRRRLEECGKQIRNPSWSGHTLTEIAFAWGFNSAAHFTRSFHEQFGVSPREYRKRGSN